MTPERWRKIEEIIHGALECEEMQRHIFLEAAFAEDPELRTEVESLISLHQEAENFLELPISIDQNHSIIRRLNNYFVDDVSQIADSLVGRKLGDFIVREKIGEGGFGVVFSADQVTLEREVVVKILHAKHRGTKKMIEGFMREARLASRLEHPYTAHVYAFGAEPDGLLWIAMELVHGTPLNKLLEKEGPLSIEKFVPLFEKICEVVQTAHEEGIIHRDLKPANVMVISRAGKLLPKLLDFGIAKIKEDNLTTKDSEKQKENNSLSTSVVKKETIGPAGSPYYMAPEQWSNASIADVRTDIYALGVLAFESITGEPPFKNISVAQEHLYSPVPPLGPSFPTAFDEVFAKAMAKKPEDRYSSALEFAHAFHEAAGLKEPQLSQATIEDRPPYPGLIPFTAADADLFFGREREVKNFLKRLRSDPFLALVGPSGAGKSSFVQAGIVPGLPDGCRAITVRPGPAPLNSLEARLRQDGIEVRDLRVALEHNPDSLGNSLRAQASLTETTLILVIDQFEEIFTLCSDPRERRQYAEALARAVRSADDPVRVVLILRDDFLMRAEKLSCMGDRFARGLQLLNTPEPSDLLSILTKPAKSADYEFDDDELPKEIVDAVANRTGALPLLAFTAAKLWDLRNRETRRLERKSYEAMGGVGGALAQHAEEMMKEMTLEEQRLVREAFRHLVTSEGTRAVLTRSELDHVLGSGVYASAILERLIASRLLIASEAEGGVERIEIAHESLLETWPRLLRWRQEDLDGARLRDQLRTAAGQWQERGRIKGLLWREEALKEYEVWRSRYPGKLTESEESFGQASLAEASRGKRVRSLIAATSFTVLIAGLLGLFLLNKQIKNQLLDYYEEQGRQELLSGDVMRASVYLSEAYSRGRKSNSLRLMLGQAIKAIDAQELSLEGHKDFVSWATYSPDGSRIATAGYDKTVKLWDARTGKLLSSLDHKAIVSSVVFSTDGTRIVTTEAGVTARVWDANNGKLLTTFYTPSDYMTVISQQGRISSYLSIYEIQAMSSGGNIYNGISSEFSPDGRHIVTTTGSNPAKVWDAANGELLLTIGKSSSSVHAAAFSPDGGRIVTAGTEGLEIWDSNSGERLFNWKQSNYNPLTLAFSPDGKKIVSASGDETVKVWWVETGKLAAQLVGHSDRVSSAIFSPNGDKIVTASYDKSVKIWDSSTGILINTLQGHTKPVLSARFSPDNKLILTASADGTARVWNAPTVAVQPLFGNNTGIVSAEFIPGGERIVTKEEDIYGDSLNAFVWDPLSNKRLMTLEGAFTLFTARYSPDGKRLVTQGSDSTLRVWDAKSGKLISSWVNTQTVAPSMAFSPDNSRIVTIAFKSANIWDAANGTLLFSLDGHTDFLSTVAFSPDGKRIVTASDDKTARVWDAINGKLLFSIEGHLDSVGSAAFSPDGKRIVTSSADQTAKIWDASTGRLLASLEGNRVPLKIAAYSPDGKIIVTLSVDRIIKLWDAEGGKLLVSINQPDKMYISPNQMIGNDSLLTFSPDGEQIIFSSPNSAQIWDFHLEKRSPKEIAEIVKKHAPYSFEQGRLVPTQ